MLRPMSHAATITSIERRLVERGISVSFVCREAGIDRATWHRWKRDGDKPRSATWDKVQAVLDRLLPPDDGAQAPGEASAAA
jgi:hypothetical protein